MFVALQERYGTALDEYINEILTLLPSDTPQLATMVRYPLGLVDETGNPENASRGKRIRPVLLLLANEAAGGNWRTAVPAAAAVEFLHNFSLVHDDIQDNSSTRRGRPAVWKLWGRSQGINVGDLLFVLSFSALQGLGGRGVKAKTRLAVEDALTESCLELTRGQYLDLHFEDCTSVTLGRYLSMIMGKSAALLSSCARIGATLAGASSDRVEHYASFGLNLGMAFQIRDDYLGLWGDPRLTGKSSATDIRSRKMTLPVLFGLEHSRQFADLHREPAEADEDVTEFLSLLEESGTREFTQRQVERWSRAARQSLNAAAPAENAGAQLHNLLDELLLRDL
ncbi:MAG: polyprenyl synthetase family protein [Anaerolineaceae bacterium]|nr:polyprenyl synthetase family protein [Anaerolineaceae bacterium]MDE0329694.1 polyprenyl synthetase family protein [Anaerolineaceae bacterium]